MDRCEIYKSVFATALNIINNDIKEIDEKINSLTGIVNSIPSGNVHDKAHIEIETKKKNKEKLEKDKTVVENYLRQIEDRIAYANETIRSSGSDEEKIKDVVNKTMENIEEIIKPFFVSYQYVLGDDSTKVKIVRGESQFKKIMKSTKKYRKIQNKIDTLDTKLGKVRIKKKLKGKTKVGILEQHKIDRVNYLKSKQVEISDNRASLILSRRQADIFKKNMKISRMEAEAKYYSDMERQASIERLNAARKGDNKAEKKQDRLADRARENIEKTEEKLRKLRTKKITVKKTRLFLLEQRFFAKFRSKYNENGALDERNWELYGTDKIDKKTGRRL